MKLPNIDVFLIFGFHLQKHQETNGKDDNTQTVNSQTLRFIIWKI